MSAAHSPLETLSLQTLRFRKARPLPISPSRRWCLHRLLRFPARRGRGLTTSPPRLQQRPRRHRLLSRPSELSPSGVHEFGSSFAADCWRFQRPRWQQRSRSSHFVFLEIGMHFRSRSQRDRRGRKEEKSHLEKTFLIADPRQTTHPTTAYRLSAEHRGSRRDVHRQLSRQ